MNLLAAFLLGLVPVIVLGTIATDFSAANVASGSATQNAALYPGVVAALMGMLVAVDVVQTIRTEGIVVPARQSVADVVRRAARPAAVFVLFLGFIFLFPRLGFVLSTLLVVAAVHLTLAPRRPLAAIVSSAVVTLLVWLVFSQLLRLSLPHGVWLD